MSKRNGISYNIDPTIEPEDFEVTFTEEEERRLHNFCLERGLITADLEKSARGGSR